MASLVLLVLVTPFFHDTHIGHLVVDGFLSLVLLAVAKAASDTRRTQIMIWALAILAMLFMWTSTADPSNPGRIAGLVIFALLITVVIGLVLRRIVLAPAVTFEVLCDSICVYLLIGLAWTLTYIAMDTINPGSFETLSTSIETGWAGFLYFSFTTLTTLGYGDISPGTPVAQMWAITEAVTGTFYIAVLVARLVSLYRV